MEENKESNVIVVKSGRLEQLQSKIEEHIEKGYDILGSVQAITEHIEIQRAGTHHKYHNIYFVTMQKQ